MKNVKIQFKRLGSKSGSLIWQISERPKREREKVEETKIKRKIRNKVVVVAVTAAVVNTTLA